MWNWGPIAPTMKNEAVNSSDDTVSFVPSQHDYPDQEKTKILELMKTPSSRWLRHRPITLIKVESTRLVFQTRMLLTLISTFVRGCGCLTFKKKLGCFSVIVLFGPTLWEWREVQSIGNIPRRNSQVYFSFLRVLCRDRYKAWVVSGDGWSILPFITIPANI